MLVLTPQSREALLLVLNGGWWTRRSDTAGMAAATS